MFSYARAFFVDHPQIPPGPTPNPGREADKEAALKADQAYAQGKWLEWAQGGGVNTGTAEAAALLGGHYPDKALEGAEWEHNGKTQVGLGGKVIAQGQQPFGGGHLGSLIYRWPGAPATPGGKLADELERGREFYQSPAVREPDRLLSKEPVDVEEDPNNVLWYWDGKLHGQDGHELPTSRNEVGQTVLHFNVPQGKRLAITNIPDGSKYDLDPKRDDEGRPHAVSYDKLLNPVDVTTIQVYHNAEGYLVADEVRNGEIVKDRPAVIAGSTENGIRLTGDSVRAMDIISSASKRRKQYVNQSRDVNNATPEDPAVQLVRLTTQWAVGSGGYRDFDIKVIAPSDTGNTIEVVLDNVIGSFPKEFNPLAFRMVDDSRHAIAANAYQ